MTHTSSVTNKQIPKTRQKSLAGCFGSSGMMDSMTNNYSGTAGMLQTKNTATPAQVFDAIKKKAKVQTLKSKPNGGDWV